MIHSLSGGIMKDKKVLDFAKVEILDDYYSGTFWFISNIKGLKENDIVLVPFKNGDITLKAKVLRVDKNVREDAAPISTKRAQTIISIVKNSNN